MDFLSRQDIYGLFYYIYSQNREYVSHLCNEENTIHMYKILKRLKKYYLINNLNKLGYHNPQIMSRGSFGLVYSLDGVNDNLVLKITGQCKFRHSYGRPIESWNSLTNNEIHLNDIVYRAKKGRLKGSDYVLATRGGVYIRCKDKKCTTKVYGKNDTNDKKNISHFKKSVTNYCNRNRVTQKLELLVCLYEKCPDMYSQSCIPLAYVIEEHQSDLSFTKLLVQFLIEFFSILYSIKINNSVGIAHNDLHGGNILFHGNSRTKYPFKVIDFGLACEKSKRNVDNIMVFDKLLIYFTYFQSYKYTHNIRHIGLLPVLTNFLSFLNNQ